MQLDIYEALTWLFERVKIVPFVKLTGKTKVWLYQKMNHLVSASGHVYVINQNDMPILQKAWQETAQRIGNLSWVPNQPTEQQPANWKIISEVFPHTFFCNVLGCDYHYFSNRVHRQKKARFTNDEICRMNAAITAMYSYMTSVQLILPATTPPTTTT